MPTLGRPRSQNSDYLIRIKNQTAGVDVMADMPDRLHIGVASHYTSRSLMLSTASIMGVGGGTASTITGADFANQDATKLIWAGTDPIRFSLSLLFDAETNSYEDVHRCCAYLQALVLPYKIGIGNILTPPNPFRNVFGAFGLGDISAMADRTTLQLGRQWYFDNINIEAATFNSEQRISIEGYPIAAAIDLNFVTDYTLSRQEYYRAAHVQDPRA